MKKAKKTYSPALPSIYFYYFFIFPNNLIKKKKEREKGRKRGGQENKAKCPNLCNTF